MSKKILFDVETNGLLDQATRVHCLVAVDADSPEKLMKFGPELVSEGIDLLKSADVLIGHNISGFDIPVIQKLHGVNLVPKKQIDTFAISKALFVSTLRESDFRRLTRGFPKPLVGRHSLESWGHRLGLHKGEFAKTTDWAEYSEEMMEYCAQDVLVNFKLYELLSKFERVKGQIAMPE